ESPSTTNAIDTTPAARKSSTMWARMGLPATLTSGLGIVWVCGRRRVPLPATGMTAFNDRPPSDFETDTKGHPIMAPPRRAATPPRRQVPSPEACRAPRSDAARSDGEPALQLLNGFHRGGIDTVEEGEVDARPVAAPDRSEHALQLRVAAAVD